MPLPGFSLRAYQPSDFEALVSIDAACFPKGIAYGSREMKGYLYTAGAHCIVAETSGAIAGFILTERYDDVAHVITLDVLAGYRRKSVGSTLLGAAEGEAAQHGAAFMYLETAITNKPAIALWKKHGYRESGRIENYYGQGQHAFEMQKRLEKKSKSKATQG